MAKDATACLAFLDFLGSRLVFLIDWNHARKQLRGFLRGPDRLALLAWAAEQDIGHRGFLELGGRFNAQGEDVVAGRQALRDNDRLRTDLPTVWTRLAAIRTELEALFGDVQISSSRCSKARCSCCRRAAPSGPTGRRWSSRWLWWTRGS